MTRPPVTTGRFLRAILIIAFAVVVGAILIGAIAGLVVAAFSTIVEALT